VATRLDPDSLDVVGQGTSFVRESGELPAQAIRAYFRSVVLRAKRKFAMGPLMDYSLRASTGGQAQLGLFESSFLTAQ
jgi:hypothetical protein